MDAKEFRALLREEREMNTMVSSEAKEELFEYSKNLMEQIAEITKGFTGLEKSLSSSYTIFEQNVQKAEKYLEGYKEKIQEFNQINDLDKEKGKQFWEEVIAKIDKDDGALAAEIRKSMEDFIKQIPNIEEIEKKKEQAKGLEKRGDGFNRLMKNIMSSKRSELGKAFGAIKIDFQLDETNLNPIAGIFKLWKENADDGIAAMKQFHNILFDIYDNHLGPSNLFFSFFSNLKQQTMDAVKAIDSVQASFMKVTGLGDKYNDMIVEGWRDNLAYNISLEDMQKSYESLIDGVRGFTLLSKQQQEGMANYTALLSRLGVGTDLASKVMSYFSDTLGHNAEQAKYAAGSILGLSEVTGDTLKTVMSAFTEALPILSKFSGQTTRVFKELYATAKSLKMEVSSLLQISENFDSYETAATNVGRLNAILGGPYLNTIKLMQMEEGERIQTLHQAFAATGKNWGALGKYERQAIASAAGISSMTDAEKLFSGSLNDVNKMMRERTITQAELEKRNQAAATLSEKMASIMSSLAVAAKPILDVLSAVLGFVQGLVEEFDGAGIAIATILLGFGWQVAKLFKNMVFGTISSVAQKIMSVVKPMSEAEKALKATAASAVGTGTKLATGIDTIAEISWKAAPKLAYAILLIGGAVAVVIGILQSTKAIGEGIASILGGIGDFFSGLGDIGTGIGEMLSGIGDSMKTVNMVAKNNSMINFIEKISSMKMDPVEKIKQLTQAITTLGETMYKLPLDQFSDFSDLFEEISDLSENTASTTSANFMNSLSEFMKATATITPEKITNVEKITKNISEMSNEISKNKNIEAVLDKLVKLISPAETNGKNGGGTIAIYMNNELKYSKRGAPIDVYGNSKMEVG
jgi:hypothetical protein